MDTIAPHAFSQQELSFTDSLQKVKRCPKCGKTKPLTEFARRSDRKSGVQSRCKICQNEVQRHIPRKKPVGLPLEQKRCSKCQEIKPASDFSKKRDHKGLLSSQCKQCSVTPKRYKECLICHETKPTTGFMRTNSKANKNTCTQCLTSHTEQKECSRCHQVKPISEYSPRKGRRSGFVSRCKQCVSETQPYRPYVKGTKYPSSNPAHQRNKSLMRAYGITSEEFDAILVSQGGVCKVCGGPPHGRRERYHVDHDHVTGKIRGLLCHKCNVALGMVQDSTDHLKALIAYLEGS